VILDPITLNSGDAQNIRGGLVVQVPLESQTPAVGIIDNSPLPLVSNESQKSANFHPIGLGSATVRLGTADGFFTPSNNTTAVVSVTP
jgi:hypothetical protein